MTSLFRQVALIGKYHAPAGAAAAAAVVVIGLLVAAWTDDPPTQPAQVVGVPNAQFE